MAKVTFINAIIQGAVEGQVYSRNRGGYYVKGYAKPLNPNSQAQAAARTRFGNAASIWHSLTDIQKAQWNAYAETHFRPKGGMLMSYRSGFQAFVSLYNAAYSAQSLARVFTMPLPLLADPSFLEFEPTLTPPSQELGVMIQTSAGAPLPMLFTNATLDSSNANFTATFGFPSKQTNAPVFEDAVGSVPVGLLFQASKSMTQAQQYVSNPAMTTLATMKPIDAIADWAESDVITVSATGADFDITKYKLWYNTGEKVSITAYLIGQNGALGQLGQLTITVT